MPQVNLILEPDQRLETKKNQLGSAISYELFLPQFFLVYHLARLSKVADDC